MKINVFKNPSLLTEGIVSLLQERFSKQTKAYASNNIESPISHHPLADLLIVDLDVDVDLFQIINLYQTNHKKIIAWTSDVEHPDLQQVFKLKLDGYFYNSMDLQEFESAMEQIINGGTYIHSKLSSHLLGCYANEHQPKQPNGIFSSREWEVIEYLGKGYKNDQIANAMFISERTVKNYVSTIMKKMDVCDRTNVVLTALKNKWIQI
ncbi:response regulator transcription factor [Aquibacillus sediminis]|uniref:response regulator transcription factor n=1 Tax=Aquibacillus sediminis TaxID=2574734 RepID=UPI0011093510|nr:response regulator transcription factor [Aquibacillus sediminis]